MEKTETHDFMKVESFSQLPFIRPAPLKEKGIRLFGKEFGGGDNSNNNDDDRSESAQTRANNPHHLQESNKDINNHRGNESNGESTRKFVCHYCCSNFPTSQALGGHQNAHKRERQQAKRAHLQSAMMHGGLAEAHVYGLMNNHRLGSVPTHHHTPLAYHSWPAKTYHHSYTNNSRFYGGGGGSFSHQSPINGSPLGLWRIPTPPPLSSSRRDDSSSMHHHPLPLFASEDLMKSTRQHQQEVVMSSNSQAKLRYETKSKLHDHVSLDLHL